jgi:hypothetical protein
VARLEAVGSYGLIAAFDAIHDQARPATVLCHTAAAWRPTGFFPMQDIRASSAAHNSLDPPLAPFMYTVSCPHGMAVSLARGSEERALQMLVEVGFTKVEVKQFPHDILNNCYIARESLPRQARRA